MRLPGPREISKSRNLRFKAQLHCADGPVALFADDHLGGAVNPRHPFLPFRQLVKFVVRGFLPLGVILLSEDKHDDVGILLDGSRFTQVAQLRAFVVAVFDLAAQLAERDDGDVEFLGDGLEALGDLGNLIDPVFIIRSARGFHELKIIYDEHVEPMGALEAPGAGS